MERKPTPKGARTFLSFSRVEGATKGTFPLFLGVLDVAVTGCLVEVNLAEAH